MLSTSPLRISKNWGKKTNSDCLMGILTCLQVTDPCQACIPVPRLSTASTSSQHPPTPTGLLKKRSPHMQSRQEQLPSNPTAAPNFWDDGPSRCISILNLRAQVATLLACWKLGEIYISPFSAGGEKICSSGDPYALLTREDAGRNHGLET